MDARILVVEDERKVAEFVARGLRDQRFAVDVANDGKAGWEMASTCNYDLVILDVGLSGIAPVGAGNAALLTITYQLGMASKTAWASPAGRMRISR